MMAMETKMSPSFANLLQLQHRGFAQMLQTFDGRVNEHEKLTGTHPITGKISVKRKRGDTSDLGLMSGRPMNALEEILLSCCDKECVLIDDASTERFLPLFHQAKTESDQAKLLSVMASTARRSNKTSSIAMFESFGGMKVARQWLDSAVSYRQTTLLHFILLTLKELPLQLASITEARINEPIVQLRKTATNEHVKKAAQELLKHWKNTFTEKPKESSSPPSKSKQGSSTSHGPKSASGTDVLGKLLQKKQEVKSNKPKDSFVTKMVQNLKKETVTSPKEVVALPTIARFDQVQSLPSSAPNSRRIKWADEHGGELTKIKLIESWRDLIMHNERDEASPSTNNSFNDAKLREHASEKFALQNKQKDKPAPIVITPTIPWRTPPTVLFPEGVVPKPLENITPEVIAQNNRTRKDVEWMILSNEVPPPNPQEYIFTPADKLSEPMKVIPLNDANETIPHKAPAGFVDETARLLEGLGPLDKSTITLLLREGEHVKARVYEEAQRNGRRITDSRVVEIIRMHQGSVNNAPILGQPIPKNQPQQRPPLLAPPVHNSAPILSNPPPISSGFGGAAPGYGAGYGSSGSNGGYNGPQVYNGPPGGYNSHNAGYNAPPPGYGPPGYGSGPPPGYGPPSSGAYGSGYGFPEEQRKSFNKRPAGGLLQEPAYPSKRQAPVIPQAPPVSAYKYKQVPCIYYNSSAGCGKGDACTFIHDDEARQAAALAEKASKYAPRGPGPLNGNVPKQSHYGGHGNGFR